MRVYRVVWFHVTFLVGGLGAIAASLGEGFWVDLGVFAMLGLSVGVTVYMTQEARSDPRSRRHALIGSVAGAAGFLALTGLLALVGQVALLIALLLALVSPPALRGYRIAIRRMLKRYRWILAPVHIPVDARGEPISDHTRPDPFDPGLVRSLTDTELHQAWHTSTAALHEAQHRRDTWAQARLAAARRAYLDELERRDPEGFRRWLAVDAQPSWRPQ
jgi:hypothetical protein